MTALVTVPRYRQITGDATADDRVIDKLAEAVERLEDILDRKLESAERTERMRPNRAGLLSPKVTPVTVCANYVIEGDQLRSAWPFAPVDLVTGWPYTYVDVTYTGGWVERSANLTATNRLPLCIEEDLCWAAMALLTPGQTSQVPAGAVSVTQGDSSVSWGPQGAPMSARSGVRWSPRTLTYRYRGDGTSC